MKFRKKPVVIEAIQYTPETCAKIQEWIGVRESDRCDLNPCRFAELGEAIAIETLEGTMSASPGDWVIRGVKGEFYPCKPDIFQATYEPVEEGCG